MGGRMVRKLFSVIVAVLVWSTLVAAQTPTSTLLWNFDRPVAEVMTYPQTVTVDGVQVPGTPSCTGNASSAVCQLPVPAPSAGPHVYAVTALSNGVQRTTSATIDLALGPGTPNGLKIIVNVTVQVGQ